MGFLVTLLFSSLVWAQSALVFDADIVKNLQAKYATDKLTQNLSVNIVSQEGKVTLSGSVDTSEEANQLISIAKDTAGVKEVESNHLKVKSSNHPLTDTLITAKVKMAFIHEKLFGGKDVSLNDVKVKTVDGIVHLSGSVNNSDAAATAIKLTKTIEGVKGVDSKIVVNVETLPH